MEELTDNHIKGFLENTPLYQWKVFQAPMMSRYSLRIGEIEYFCEACEKNRPFHDRRPKGGLVGGASFLATGQSFFEFTCVSCNKEKKEYWVQQVVDDDTIKIQKCGELPRERLVRDSQLQKFFANDADNFEKATVCLSHGYGIAAFAYMRRIVEKNIATLLDMLQEDIETTDADTKLIDDLMELRKESPMSEKIKIANQAMPGYLIPSGLNPLGRLYQALSEGVHSHTDEECLDLAAGLMGCIKYLISELASRKKSRDAFKVMVGGI